LSQTNRTSIEFFCLFSARQERVCRAKPIEISARTDSATASMAHFHLHAHLLVSAGYSKQQLPRYSLVFRITNLEWNDKLANVEGTEFKQLASPVKQAVCVNDFVNIWDKCIFHSD
jgi:hypothetical protein